MTPSRPDAPYRREYADGRVVWVARYTNPVTGKREYAHPEWNRRKATFVLRRDAQRAINEAIEHSARPDVREDTVVGYANRWTELHPRAERTNKTNLHRINRLLDVEIEGKPLGHYLLHEVRVRHANALLDHMLRVQRRTITGCRNIFSAYSAMYEDAIADEYAERNPFRKVKLRATDPRIRKWPRRKRVWTYPDMHSFAAGSRQIRDDNRGLQRECMIRALSDCGLRLGEMLALRREDFRGGYLHVEGTANEGRILTVEGSTKFHKRVVPVPPSLADKLAVLLEHMPDHTLMFPTYRGRVWRESNFYRDLWLPTRRATGLDIEPHEMRHSYLSTLRAAGVDDADLATVAGHSVETLLNTYTHALGKSDDAIRQVIG